MYLLGFLIFFVFSVYGFICFLSKVIAFVSVSYPRNNTRVQEYKDRLKPMP